MNSARMAKPNKSPDQASKLSLAQLRADLYDHMGRPYKGEIPRVMSAKWMRTVYRKGLAQVGEYDDMGVRGDHVREALLRAQIPYVVTLLVYESKFQIAPTRREYFVYSPGEQTKAAALALRLWQRWERPPREAFVFEDLRDVFPKVDDGICAEPITDKDYDEHWKYVRNKPHRAAGNPEDPFAFTCLDPDVMVFKVTDFQAGLDFRI